MPDAGTQVGAHFSAGASVWAMYRAFERRQGPRVEGERLERRQLSLPLRGNDRLARRLAGAAGAAGAAISPAVADLTRRCEAYEVPRPNPNPPPCPETLTFPTPLAHGPMSAERGDSGRGVQG